MWKIGAKRQSAVNIAPSQLSSPLRDSHRSSLLSLLAAPHLHPVCWSCHGVEKRELKGVNDPQNLVEVPPGRAGVLANESYSLVQVYDHYKPSTDDGLGGISHRPRPHQTIHPRNTSVDVSKQRKGNLAILKLLHVLDPSPVVALRVDR